MTAITSLPALSVFFAVPSLAPTPQIYAIPPAQQLATGGGSTLSNADKAIAADFSFVRQMVPDVAPRMNSPYNSIAARDTAALLNTQRQTDALEIKQQYDRQYLTVQSDAFNSIFQSLLSLRMQAANLRNVASFNPRTALAQSSAVASATAGPNAATGTHTLQVSQLARNQSLSSNVYADPSRPLGLVGSFTIGSLSMTVQASDSLNTIADTINYGEDLNHNGKLDPATDVLGNGSMGVFSVPGVSTGTSFLPPFYLNQNADRSGVAHPKEDLNNNGILDGTSVQTGIRASVAGGQLVVTSNMGGDVAISMTDPNGVLENLGFITRNDATREVSANPFNPQSALPQVAQFMLDGVPFTSPTNSGIQIGGLTLNLNRTGSTTISVSEDLSRATQAVQDFSASFNDAVGLMNGALMNGGVLSDNGPLQAIYADTVRTLFSSLPAGTADALASVQDAGLSVSVLPSAVPQTTLEQLPDIMSSDLKTSGVGPDSWFNQTGHLSINSVDTFKVTMDPSVLVGQLQNSPSSVADLFGYAAARLQSRLDVHLNPSYGTITLQQGVLSYYRNNQDQVAKLMTQNVGITGLAIETKSARTLFQSIGKGGFSATA